MNLRNSMVTLLSGIYSMYFCGYLMVGIGVFLRFLLRTFCGWYFWGFTCVGSCCFPFV